MSEFDVIICGAGPAGCTCALGLFDAGLSVALIDKQSFPREKICGDAFGGYAHKILNTISPAFGKRMRDFKDGVMVKRAKITSPRGHALELSLKGFFSILPRSIFDHFLLNLVKEETNTSVLENTSLEKLMIQKDGILVTTSDGRALKAKVIVGCDGVHSLVQSELTQTRKLQTETCPSLRGYYKNIKGLESNCLEIHFLKTIPKGYFWIFPTNGGVANVGIGADKEIITRHNINMRKTLQTIIEQSEEFKSRFADAELVGEIKGWTIPIGYFNSKLSISGDRVLLCGDAAALVDPATGEGIGPAMSSGRYAARQIKACFNGNDFSAAFMKSYDRQIKLKYARNYFTKTTMAALYYRFPFLLDWAVYGIAKINRFRNHT